MRITVAFLSLLLASCGSDAKLSELKLRFIENVCLPALNEVGYDIYGGEETDRAVRFCQCAADPSMAPSSEDIRAIWLVELSKGPVGALSVIQNRVSVRCAGIMKW
jgi:hypothetical protein